MQRGVLNTTHSALTATPVKEQDWTLDATGNWSGFVDKINGTTDLSQTRMANKVNEITAIAATTGPTWVTPQYDQAGNTIRFPQVADPTQGFTAVYDAWNRMVSISSTGGGGSSSSSSGSSGSSSSSSGRSVVVAQYSYDGRGFQILKNTYTGGMLPETRHFYFTSRWQGIEERVNSSTAMSNQYIWGVRYIDELVERDGAASSSHSSSSSYSGSPGLRLYALQDANFNVTAISNRTGSTVERFVFDPYGVVQTRSSSWAVWVEQYSWSTSFQGQYLDTATMLNNCRNRYYSPTAGAWLQRDFVNLKNLYCFLSQQPLDLLDPLGLNPVAHVLGKVAKAGLKKLKQYLDEAFSTFKKQLDCGGDTEPHASIGGGEAVHVDFDFSAKLYPCCDEKGNKCCYADVEVYIGVGVGAGAEGGVDKKQPPKSNKGGSGKAKKGGDGKVDPDAGISKDIATTGPTSAPSTRPSEKNCPKDGEWDNALKLVVGGTLAEGPVDSMAGLALRSRIPRQVTSTLRGRNFQRN